MVKRTSLEHADCPIARALDVIGDWWSLLIIRDALLGAAASANSRRALDSPRTSSPYGYARWSTAVSSRWRLPPTAAPIRNMC